MMGIVKLKILSSGKLFADRFIYCKLNAVFFLDAGEEADVAALAVKLQQALAALVAKLQQAVVAQVGTGDEPPLYDMAHDAHGDAYNNVFFAVPAMKLLHPARQ